MLADDIDMRDFPAKAVAPLPTISINGPGLKYLSNCDNSSIKDGKRVKRSPKLSRQSKSLSFEEPDPLILAVKSPRLRRLKLTQQSMSLDGHLKGTVEPSRNRSRSPRPRTEPSLPIKISDSSDNLFASDTLTSPRPRLARSSSPRPVNHSDVSEGFKSLSINLYSDNLLGPDVSGSPPKISGSPPKTLGTSPRLNPTPPRSPREFLRSRSKSPSAYRHTGIVFQSGSFSRQSSFSRHDSDELTPWDFPNSLRSHPRPKSPKPPRRLAPVKAISESASDTLDPSQQTHSSENNTFDLCTNSGENENHNQDTKITEAKVTKESSMILEGEVEDFSENELDPCLNPIKPHQQTQFPNSSDFFQQALEALRNRESRSSSRSSSAHSYADPGDLHVSRSSLVISKISDHLDAETNSENELDTVEKGKEVNEFKARKTWMDAIRSVLDVVEPRVKKRQAQGRQDPIYQYGRRRATIAVPRMDQLQVEGTNHDLSKNKLSGLGEAARLLVQSESARRKVKEENTRRESKISIKAAFHLTKFITAACASESVGGNENQSAHLVSTSVTRLPEICNHGRIMKRQRRDSLRLARYMVEEQSPLGDATEVASFDDLKNCRYLRTSQSQRELRRKNSLLGCNEV